MRTSQCSSYSKLRSKNGQMQTLTAWGRRQPVKNTTRSWTSIDSESRRRKGSRLRQMRLMTMSRSTRSTHLIAWVQCLTLRLRRWAVIKARLVARCWGKDRSICVDALTRVCSQRQSHLSRHKRGQMKAIQRSWATNLKHSGVLVNTLDETPLSHLTKNNSHIRKILLFKCHQESWCQALKMLYLCRL